MGRVIALPVAPPEPELPPEVPELGALRAVRSARPERTLAALLVALLVVAGLALLVPWVQTAGATGKVIAWNPNDRAQLVDAPVEGRVARVHVTEGAHVAEGDVLVELTDNDPRVLARLEEERSALADRVASARSAVLELEGRILDLQESRTRAVSAAEARLAMARDRATAAAERVVEMEAQRERDLAQLERRREGVARGVASPRDLEVAEADARRAEAQLAQARASARAAESESVAAREDLGRVAAEADANVASARNARDAAEMTEQGAVAELARTEVRVSRQETMIVRAPRAGRVLRVVANPGAELLKPGDPLVLLVPDTEERAVELWVDGRDVPFVREGEVARLQFEGWPALQFAGLPGASSGTFGGRVVLVDAATDDGGGRFRVLVAPDPEEPEWPTTDRLRQGNRAAAWITLGRVPLGAELWRLVNGFPPAQPPSKKSEPAIGIERKGKK